MNNIPQISVVMSVFNGKKYLQEAIESILGQTFTDFEFIIIDDGSTDESAAIINSYNDVRIRLIQQENKGLAAALNRGIKAAKGKYIARMDADDISMKDRLEKQYEFLEIHSRCVAVGTNAVVIDMNGKLLYTSCQLTDWEEIKNILPATPFFHSSTTLRREVVVKCGGYYEKLKYGGQDLILFNKMARFGELRNINEFLIEYRLRPSATTNISTKTDLVRRRIFNNILANGTISQPDLNLLQSITQKRSERWKKSNYYLRIGKIYIEKNLQRRKAAKNLIKSLLYYPLNGIAWFNLLLLVFPKVLIEKWKKYRQST